MTPEPDWVDLGLPSGLLWAKANLGATVPSSPGLYYSWGNIEGHPNGGGYDFSQSVYSSTPGASINSNLDLQHDAANVALGGSARMPTVDDLRELIQNTTSAWTTLNGIRGRLFTSRLNAASIFLPAVGYMEGTSRESYGVFGLYWSSTYESQDTCHRLNILSSGADANNVAPRYSGFCIRAVRPT